MDAPLPAPEVLAENRPPVVGRMLLGLAGVSAGVAILTLAANEGSVPLAILAPLASGAAVYGVGETLGYGGDADRTLMGTALGALPGLAITVVGLTMEQPQADEWITDGTVVAAIGALVYVAGGSVGAVLGYSSRSVLGLRIQRGPTYESVPSLALRIGL